MKEIKLSYLYLFIALFYFTSCKREKMDEKINAHEIASSELLEKAKLFQDNTTAKGIQVLSVNSKEAGLKSKLENVKFISGGRVVNNPQLQDAIVCSGLAASLIVNYYVDYTGTCAQPGSYTVPSNNIKLLLGQGGAPRLTHPYNLVAVKYSSGVYTVNMQGTVTNPTSTNGIYSISVPSVNLTAAPNSLPFCSLSTMDVIISVEVSCDGGYIMSGDVVLTIDLNWLRTAICYTVCPAFFQPNPSGAGTASLNGWISCANNPCLDFADGVEFQYRKVGTTTWTTYNLIPYQNNVH
jgi:hypothetical protein